MFLYPSSVYGNTPTVRILALGLVYLFSPLSTCPLQVCLSSLVEPCVWIHGSHAIWCQQAPSEPLIHSQNSPRSISHGSNLKESQVSHKSCLKFKITSWKTPFAHSAVHHFCRLNKATKKKCLEGEYCGSHVDYQTKWFILWPLHHPPVFILTIHWPSKRLVSILLSIICFVSMLLSFLQKIIKYTVLKTLISIMNDRLKWYSHKHIKAFKFSLVIYS